MMWHMNTISISKQRVRKEQGVVVLSSKEYQKLAARAVPEYYLTGKAAERLDKRVKEGLKEWREGKTKTIKSLKDLY